MEMGLGDAEWMMETNARMGTRRHQRLSIEDLYTIGCIVVP